MPWYCVNPELIITCVKIKLEKHFSTVKIQDHVINCWGYVRFPLNGCIRFMHVNTKYNFTRLLGILMGQRLVTTTVMVNPLFRFFQAILTSLALVLPVSQTWNDTRLYDCVTGRILLSMLNWTCLFFSVPIPLNKDGYFWHNFSISFSHTVVAKRFLSTQRP